MAPPPSSSSSSSIDSARLLCFSPAAIGHLVVVTAGAKLLKLSAPSGQLLSEVRGGDGGGGLMEKERSIQLLIMIRCMGESKGFLLVHIYGAKFGDCDLLSELTT